MQFSGSQITRLSTVHGRRHSSIDHFVCNAPARALLTSPRVDRQTAVANHFVIRTSIRAEAQGQPPVPRALTISRHHCLEATDRIATSNYWDPLDPIANFYSQDVPPTPFARALLRVCGQVFASATIPRAWLCASIVSIDKKDGDSLNPGDKRGIALINVGLKLVCKVLQMRIERFVETNNLLSYEQAGFRKREECVGQVVSLVDIIQRRQNAGLNTHVLFIDIRKAFDTVPVGALLWKLQNMGFLRRTLAFLKALYTSSSARARAGSLLSDPFPVQRGVRQGCPLSGLLFNLFINDILDGVAPITVPGLS
ncbi:hypothetical protein BASA50_008988 [Batrachochytrium salamandrivorans]|uniref:Reverse transcriptase domain-containing protein n=1 Tax=Batrachochytrium salamandrivorans TaxID=1357716 RepID=A0ABQ8F2K6_9FUNG|nr:hypothetical protein BASA62_000050 [Batrachochytrium salamandrivorans]KAH6590988.1 hypothetical protein BASA50_008988 [Batrachochytrium salamandrivorans]KAH9268587.1 hypothetical protein BASA84_000192 [Batrachochytrium salamandrivorans]KAH9268589.1 hypothetical protein BASA84_000195 [Batrachochytrium salamandrivorans]